MSDDDTHPRCTCAEGLESEHPCPFAGDVHGDDEATCTCCEVCTEACADSI